MAKKKKDTSPEVPVEKEATGLVQKSNGQFDYIAKRRSVRAKTRRRTATLVVTIFLLAAVLITAAVYAILAFIDFNSFRITVDRSSGQSLSLSQDFEFTKPSSALGIDGPKFMDNVAYESIDIEGIVNGEGELNGDNYIANTFYLRNNGLKDCRYVEEVTLSNTYKGLEAAMRLLIVRNVYEEVNGEWVPTENVYTCYAKERTEPLEDGTTQEYVSGGNGDQVVPDPVPHPVNEDEEWLCVNFISDSIILHDQQFDIQSKQIVRYSIVVWIEGTDLECVDDVLGGKVSLSVKFSSISDEE